jgi:hypothetical protein
MSVTVKSVIDKVLRKCAQDGDSLVSRDDCLTYYNTARRNLNEFVNIVKGNERINGIAGQYRYSLPSDYKSNLYRVEYDFVALTKASLAGLDGYDKNWRDANSRNSPDSTPQFFVPDSGEANKFYIYPPPGSTGESEDLTGFGLPEDILGEDTTDEGFPEERGVDGETIEMTEPGIPEAVIPQNNNIRIYYEKYFVNIESENNTDLDEELEPYQEAIVNYMLFEIYTSKPMLDTTLSKLNWDLYMNWIEGLKRKKLMSRAPLGFTIKRKSGFMWGRRENA